MRIGETWTPVELLDESAGGFGVRVDLLPEIAVGDVVRLRSGEKCFDVEVMHVTHCPAVDGFHDERRDEPVCILGVKRVSEVFLEADARSPCFERIRATWQQASFLFDGKGLATGIALAFLVGILSIVVLSSLGPNLFGNRESNSSTDDNSFNPELLGSYSNPFKMKLGGEAGGSLAAAPNDDVSVAKPLLNERQKDVWQSLLDHAKLQTDIEPWRTAVLALIANTVEQRNLTDLQRVEIAQLLNYTDESLANLDSADSIDNREDVARKRSSILEDAYISLMQMFTDAQQIEWDKLVEKWDEASSAPSEPLQSR